MNFPNVVQSPEWILIFYPPLIRRVAEVEVPTERILATEQYILSYYDYPKGLWFELYFGVFVRSSGHETFVYLINNYQNIVLLVDLRWYFLFLMFWCSSIHKISIAFAYVEISETITLYSVYTWWVNTCEWNINKKGWIFDLFFYIIFLSC